MAKEKVVFNEDGDYRIEGNALTEIDLQREEALSVSNREKPSEVSQNVKDDTELDINMLKETTSKNTTAQESEKKQTTTKTNKLKEILMSEEPKAEESFNTKQERVPTMSFIDFCRQKAINVEVLENAISANIAQLLCSPAIMYLIGRGVYVYGVSYVDKHNTLIHFTDEGRVQHCAAEFSSDTKTLTGVDAFITQEQLVEANGIFLCSALVQPTTATLKYTI